METEGAAVPPRAVSGRRYKAALPWRFQPGFVRQHANNPASPAAATPRGIGGLPLGGSVGRGYGSAPARRGGRSARGRGGLHLRGGTRSAAAKGSDGAKVEDDPPSGPKKYYQLNTGVVIVDSSNADYLESGSCSGAKKDYQLMRGTPSAAAKSSCVEIMDNSPCSGAEKDSQLKRVTRSAAAKSSDLVEMEDGARSGSGVDCDMKRHTRSATAKSSDGAKMEDGAHSVAEKGCQSKTGTNSVAAESSSVEIIMEKGARGGTGKDRGENCASVGSKMSRVNGSGLKSNGSSAGDRVGEELAANGAAKESDVGAKRCSPAGPGGNGNAASCRRGRKELVPWRFQIGYKRSFSQAFRSNSVSPETPECRAQGSSTQCTPGTRSTVRCYASPHSSVRVSAVRDFSSGKGEKETRTAYKKMKTVNYDQNQGMPETGVSVTRETVMKSLKDFRLIYKKLSDDLDSAKDALDLQAYKIFRDRFSAQCDDKKYVGHVPGVHVGDIFHIRVELCVVGLHRPHRLGIDHIKEENGTCIAVSIVAYARFSDVKNNLDAFVYSGSLTAQVSKKIDGINLALKKSMDTSTPVRVIHGFSAKGNNQRKMLIYGGLYLVEKYWREKESEGRYVYMFRLRRMAGQKHIDIKEILKSGQTGPYDGVIMKDLSQGLERIPIPVVNSISDEHPMPYDYMSRLKYPPNYQPAPPVGCACVGGCSDSKRCACAMKNGGEIPFNDKGCIIAAKPLVYECGPSCMCPPTCHNRVGQKGMKFRLQVFKTESMGWGVKTLDFIPSGSFVCEYIGEVLHDEEAQKRKNDEYLFAIGHNYYDETLWEGLSRSIPSLQKVSGEDEDAGFAVDASKMGNFAKFINHSCTPNLYAQNVLYDHDDKSAPHIMFFACENIPPCQELAYHYNYAIDQVYDANGNIKKKKCLCGSFECDGWLY